MHIVPDQVIDLQYNITYIGSNNVNITVYWNVSYMLLYQLLPVYFL